MCRRTDKTTRGRAAAAFALACAAALSVEGPARAQAPPSRPTFPSQVELITVDAVVVDDDGRPVPGLTADDFVVKEDGRVQEIASFEAFVLDPVEAPAAPPVIASNEVGARSSHGRAFAILVDDLRIAPQRTAVARRAVATFLERSVRQGDLVSLRTSSGDLSWTARVPEGAEDLMAVLSRLEGRDVALQSVDRMSEYEAFQIANREDAPSMSGGGPVAPGSRVPAGEEPPVPGTGLGSTKERVKKRWLEALLCTPINCDRVVRARAQEIDASRRARTQLTMDALRRELAALALDRGRKSLLLLSDGFVEDYGSDLREVAALSRQANTAIYFLDVRGLVSDAGFGGADEVATFALPDPREQAQMRFEATALAAAGAQTLADQTGGFSVRNTNDLGAGMERIARESRVFYMLGFYPPPGKSGREWRKLSVEVKRPGLTVRARRGYTLHADPALLDPPRPRKKGKPQEGPSPALVAALDSAQDVPGIPLRVMSYVLEPRPNDRIHVLVAAEMDASRLTLVPSGRGQAARLDVSVVAVGRDTGRGFRHDDAIELPLRPGEPPGWRALVREFELPAGITTVRVAVRDATSGLIGAVSQRIEVPLAGAFRLSTPILTDRIEPAPDAQSAPRPALAVHRTFPAQGGLYLQFEVFGGARDRSLGAPRVTAGLELWAPGNRLARRVDPTPIAVDGAGRVVRQVGLSLEGMPEGPYDLVLDVRDEVSGARLKHRESFTLAPS